MDETAPKMRQFTDEELAELAADPDNVVYRYEDVGAPLETVVPLDDVRHLVDELWAIRRVLGSELTFKQADRLRRRTERQDPRFLAFSKSHPLMFDEILGRRTTEKSYRAMLHMIGLHRKTGGSKGGRAQLEKYVMRTFAQPAPTPPRA